MLKYFSLQNNKCVCHIANTQNNNNLEIIKVIHNCETVYVWHCSIHSLKNGVGHFSMGESTNSVTLLCMDFLCRAFLCFT